MVDALPFLEGTLRDFNHLRTWVNASDALKGCELDRCLTWSPELSTIHQRFKLSTARTNPSDNKDPLLYPTLRPYCARGTGI
jgi:hypothetical protein